MIYRDLFIAALLVVLGSVLLECFGSLLGLLVCFVVAMAVFMRTMVEWDVGS